MTTGERQDGLQRLAIVLDQMAIVAERSERAKIEQLHVAIMRDHMMRERRHRGAALTLAGFAHRVLLQL